MEQQLIPDRIKLWELPIPDTKAIDLPAITQPGWL